MSTGLISAIDLAKVDELIALHDEAYGHAMERDSHHKSSEGYVSINFGTVFDRTEYGGSRLTIRGVEVYSYVLGPSRTHHFSSVDEALAEVRKWHAEEMAAVE